MAITDRVYRTCTYIAGDWENDFDAVNQLKKWNEGRKWGLSFTDVHELTQSRDGSLNCSIKASLKARMNVSKTFVLIVGQKTNSLRSGACFLCAEYNSANYFNPLPSCNRNYVIDNKSYVEYECDKAVEAGINIIVLYNSISVDKSKCPSSVRYKGQHVAMIYKAADGYFYWDYNAVKKAFDNL